jgi:hypothetical protein
MVEKKKNMDEHRQTQMNEQRLSGLDGRYGLNGRYGQ